MKKLIVLLLVIAMAFTLFASCKSKTPDGNDDGSSPKTTTTDPNKNTNNPDENGFVAVEKTLYVSLTNDSGSLNIRETPSADASTKILGTLPQGAAVKVTAENTTLGWVRIDYNGAVGYVNSTYLSAEKPNIDVIEDTLFTAVNEKVYAYATGGAKDEHLPDVKVKAYLRPYKEGWSDKKAEYLLANYTEFTRVGVYYNDPADVTVGWSKVTYFDAEQNKEVTIYIRNSQLVTELPANTTPAQ